MAGVGEDRLKDRLGWDHEGKERAKERTRGISKEEPRTSDDGMHSSVWQKRSSLHGGLNHHTDRANRMIPERGGRTKRGSPRGNSRSEAAVSAEMLMHKPSVRRRVQFDQPAPTQSDQSPNHQRNGVDYGLNGHLETNGQVQQGVQRSYPKKVDLDDYDQYSDEDSYGVPLPRELSDHDGMPFNYPESKKLRSAPHAKSKQGLEVRRQIQWNLGTMKITLLYQGKKSWD